MLAEIRRPWFFNIIFHITGRVLRMISDPVMANVFLKPIFNPSAIITLFLSFLLKNPGPSCSKLTTSLVNDSLKFTSSDTQIC